MAVASPSSPSTTTTSSSTPNRTTGLRARLPARRAPHARHAGEDEGLGRPATAGRAHRTGPQTLSYGGAIDNIGVMSGAKSKVYLVFYGTQWGTQTRRQRNAKFSNDSAGAASVAQQMFKGFAPTTSCGPRN